jgi:hypothetical protein
MSKVLMPEREVPRMAGWLTAEEVSEKLDVSRAYVQRWFNEDWFATLRAVGGRPLYVIREEEVDRLEHLRDKTDNWLEAKELLHRERAKWQRKRWPQT